MTGDRWQDTWWGVNLLSKVQLSSSSGLGFMVFWRSGGKWSLSKSINDKAVCWTASATPGLLKKKKKLQGQVNFNSVVRCRYWCSSGSNAGDGPICTWIDILPPSAPKGGIFLQYGKLHLSNFHLCLMVRHVMQNVNKLWQASFTSSNQNGITICN